MKREDAIEFVKEAFIAWESEYRVPHEDWTETYKARDMAIKALHDRPSGKWIIKYDAHSDIPIREYYCDQCGKRGGLGTMLFDDKPLPNFCGNCGAEMKGGADD